MPANFYRLNIPAAFRYTAKQGETRPPTPRVSRMPIQGPASPEAVQKANDSLNRGDGPQQQVRRHGTPFRVGAPKMQEKYLSTAMF